MRIPDWTDLAKHAMATHLEIRRVSDDIVSIYTVALLQTHIVDVIAGHHALDDQDQDLVLRAAAAGIIEAMCQLEINSQDTREE